MAKKKYLITLDPEVHSKLILYSSEAGVSLGDTINLLTHAAESRIDLARLSEDWAYPEQASSTGPSDTLLRQIELFILHDAAKVAELEKTKIEITKQPSTNKFFIFLSFQRQFHYENRITLTNYSETP